GLTYGLGVLLKIGNDLAMETLPSLLLVPVLGGLIASYVWRSLRPSIEATVLNTVWMTLFALVLATAALREGVICLLILSPLYFASILTGALLGRIFFK